MRLETLLKITPPSQLLPQFNSLLNQAHVRLSRWGTRLVRVDNYAGEVSINTLADAFLRATPLKRYDAPSLQERLDCYHLWERVQELYDQSEEQVKRTCLSGIFARFRECPAYFCPFTEESSMIIMAELDETKEDVLFKFSRNDYIRHFPQSASIARNKPEGTYVYATKRSIERAIASQK